MAVMDPVGESKYVRAELRTIVFNHGGFVRGQCAGWCVDFRFMSGSTPGLRTTVLTSLQSDILSFK